MVVFHDQLSHLFSNVTLDFNNFTVIAVFMALLTSFDTDSLARSGRVLFALNTSLHHSLTKIFYRIFYRNIL
jgi:hypothetical protein